MGIPPADPARVATVLPGLRYSPSAPLLRYATLLLVERGWTVNPVTWRHGDRTTPDDAIEQSRRELAAVDAPVHLVVAKSVGSFALLDAVELGLPGVWLTPILTDARLAVAVRRLAAPALLVGGTADPSWDRAAARLAMGEVLEIEGGNHSLEVGASLEPSLDALRLVMTRMAAFVDALATSPAP